MDKEIFIGDYISFEKFYDVNPLTQEIHQINFGVGMVHKIDNSKESPIYGIICIDHEKGKLYDQVNVTRENEVKLLHKNVYSGEHF